MKTPERHLWANPSVPRDSGFMGARTCESLWNGLQPNKRNLIAMAPTLVAMVPTLVAMASNLLGMDGRIR